MKSQTSVGKRPSRLSFGSQVSMLCSECQSGGKFKQAWLNGGSIYDSVKVPALNVKVMEISNKRE